MGKPRWVSHAPRLILPSHGVDGLGGVLRTPRSLEAHESGLQTHGPLTSVFVPLEQVGFATSLLGLLRYVRVRNLARGLHLSRALRLLSCDLALARVVLRAGVHGGVPRCLRPVPLPWAGQADLPTSKICGALSPRRPPCFAILACNAVVFAGADRRL